MSPNFLAHQVNAKLDVSRAEWAAGFGDKLLEAQSVRLFKYLGAALAVIGMAGFVAFQV